MSRASVDTSPSAERNEAMMAVVDSSACLPGQSLRHALLAGVRCQGPLVLLQQLGADRLWEHSRCVKAGHALHRDPFVSSLPQRVKTLTKDPLGEKEGGLGVSTLDIPCPMWMLSCLHLVSNPDGLL